MTYVRLPKNLICPKFQKILKRYEVTSLRFLIPYGCFKYYKIPFTEESVRYIVETYDLVATSVFSDNIYNEVFTHSSYLCPYYKLKHIKYYGVMDEKSFLWAARIILGEYIDNEG